MKTVLVFGTFDLFHEGHRYFLQQAKAYGDRLVVIVARDNNVQAIKGRAPHDNETVRREHIAQFSAVDEARLGYEDWSQHVRALEDVQPDVICLGYDQQAHIPEGPWRVVRIDAYKPDQYKSSILRKQLRNEC